MSQYEPAQFWNDAAKDPDVRYKYIADEWVNTTLMVNDIKNSMPENVTHVSEIGCGIGRLLVPLAESMPDVKFFGYDISIEMLKRAERKPNIIYGDLGHMNDMIYSMLVFQHINDTDKITYIKTAYNKLRKGGIFLFQFVVGTENAPYSFQTNEKFIGTQLAFAGFKSVTFTRKYMHPSWVLVRAVK